MRKIFQIIDAIVSWVSNLVIIALIIIAALQIISRYIFNHAFSWTEEVSLMLVLWLAYFGMVMAMRKEAHLRVDAFVMGLPQKYQHWLHVLVLLGAILCSLFVSWISLETALKIMSRGQTASSIPLPLWIVWMAIPICFLLSGLQALRRFVIALTGKEF